MNTHHIKNETEVLVRKAEAILLAAHDQVCEVERYSHAIDSLQGHLARGIPERYAKALLVDDFENTAPMAHVRKMIDRFTKTSWPTFIIMAGGLGTGKTWAAVKLAIHFDAQFIPASKFIAMSRFREDTCMVEAGHSIVLDDLGEESDEPWAVERIVTLLCRRYTHGLRTVITTNLNYQAIVDRYGPRLDDRFREAGLLTTYRGESLRVPSKDRGESAWERITRNRKIMRDLTHAVEYGLETPVELRRLIRESCTHMDISEDIEPVPAEECFSSRRARVLKKLEDATRIMKEKRNDNNLSAAILGREAVR